MTNSDNQSAPQFIKLEEVAEQVRMGKSTVLSWEANNKFPRAVRLSINLRVWLKSDVDEWMMEQRAKSLAIFNKAPELLNQPSFIAEHGVKSCLTMI